MDMLLSRASTREAFMSGLAPPGKPGLRFGAPGAAGAAGGAGLSSFFSCAWATGPNAIRLPSAIAPPHANFINFILSRYSLLVDSATSILPAPFQKWKGTRIV